MGQKYVVSGTLNHGVELDEKGADGRHLVRVDVYHDGDAFETDDAALERELRRTKAILLPEEYAAAAASEGNAGLMEQLAAERVAKDARIAELEAQLAQRDAAAQSEQPSADGSADKSDGASASDAVGEEPQQQQ